MELAWNTQKNQMSDVKGKEMEQERAGKIKNEDIDRERTKDNYDLVQSDRNLYQRVKNRVDDLKKEGSRVQKNSVVMYSNILTVPEEQAKKWGREKTAAYFESCRDFFCEEFGKENVVSAKVHQDETTPHMHLHFVPVNKENGRLQARTAMNKAKVNHIHDALPKFLQERGFNVYRGSGKTKDKNIEDVHEYKEVQKKVAEKSKELADLMQALPDSKEPVPFVKKETAIETVKSGLFNMQKEKVEKETGNVVLSAEQYENLTETVHAAVAIKKDYERLKATDLAQANEELRKDVEVFAKAYSEERDERVELEKENEKLRGLVSKLSEHSKALTSEIKHLKMNIAVLYKNTHDYLKEGFKDFRERLKGSMEKNNVENEFEKVYEHQQNKKRQRDQGMEL